MNKLRGQQIPKIQNASTPKKVEQMRRTDKFIGETNIVELRKGVYSTGTYERER